MAARTAATILVPLATAMLLVACGGSDEVSSSTPPPTPSTTSTTSTTEAPATTTSTATTVPPTTTTPPTTGPTTAPSSTAPPTTAPATAPGTSAPPTAPLPPAPATFFAARDLDLVEIDVASGTVINTIEPFFTGDGVFRGGLRLSPDRSTIYYSEGYEDSWYSCETSVGVIGAISVADGTITPLGPGSGIQLNADGTRIVHLGSQSCVPDPQQPDLWVLTPSDRAIVRDLASGATTEFVTATPPDAYDSATALGWADLADDGSLLVLTGAGEIHRIPSGATGAIQDFPVVVTTDATPLEIVGDRIIAAIYGDEGSTDLVSISLADGSVASLASTESYMTVGVDPSGRLIAAADGPIAVEPGADVAIVEFPIDGYFYDLDW
jgi:hypothetical protein